MARYNGKKKRMNKKALLHERPNSPSRLPQECIKVPKGTYSGDESQIAQSVQRIDHQIKKDSKQLKKAKKGGKYPSKF